MSYHSKLSDFGNELPRMSENRCLCCGGYLGTNSPVVSYECQTEEEGAKPHKTRMLWVLMHPSCANAMAQRLITDTWVKRREWQDELINLK